MQARQAALGRQGVGRMPRSGHQQTWRPNKPLELTPLRVERDRADFEGRFPLEGFPNLQGGAAQRQAVRRLACRHEPKGDLRDANRRRDCYRDVQLR
jgi:hypothetical protein